MANNQERVQAVVRGRGVAGEITMGETADNRLPFVEALFELKAGRQAGRRFQWRGYLTTESAADRTVKALRAAGWTGASFGDWAGFGDVDVDCTLEQEDEQNPAPGAPVRKFWRVAFVNAVRTLQVKNRLNATMVGDLSKKWASKIGVVGAPESEPDGELYDDDGARIPT